MRSSFIIVIATFFLLVVSCNQKQAQTDNLYLFKEYVSYHTNGVQRIVSPIVIGLTNPLKQFELNQDLPLDYITISPKVVGVLKLQNGSEMVFVPEKPLKPATEYSVTVALSKLIPNISKGFETYTFNFKTIAPSFRLETQDVQSYNKRWQYIEGALNASDVLPAEEISEILSVYQGSRKLKVVWDNLTQNSSYYTFKIDSIERQEQDQIIRLVWDGHAVGVDNQGEEEFKIPGLNQFIVLSAKTTPSPNASLTINLSDPIASDQNFEGLVTLSDHSELRYEVIGNNLKIYPSTISPGEVSLTVHEGLKSIYGFALAKSYTTSLTFEQPKPEVRMISSGTILPNSSSTPLFFETVSLAGVEVRVIEIFQSNVLQYLQNNDLSPGYRTDLRPVGRRVAYKVIDLSKTSKNLNSWTAHALDLSELFHSSPGSIYRVELSFKPEHIAYSCDRKEPITSFDFSTQQDETEKSLEERYWDNELYEYKYVDWNWEERDNPCHPAYYHDERIAFTTILGSDLGLIVKQGKSGNYRFVATNLITAAPEPNTQVQLYNYQKQLIGTVTTDNQGFAQFKSEETPAFVVGINAANYCYLKLEDGQALSMSKFDISGQSIQKGIQGYLYTERGVYRPGETIHLTFVKDDRNNPLPQNHPVTMEVTNARGSLVYKTTLTTEDQGINPIGTRKGSFYYFPIATKPEDPTGTWEATVTIGGIKFSKNIKVATVKPNRLKLDIGFNEEWLKANQNLNGKLTAQWLHGAAAGNLKAKIELNLKSKNPYFDKYKAYVFYDPARKFSELNLNYLETQLDANGMVSLANPIKVNSNIPGMLEATFTTTVYEEGGDFSLDVFKKPIATYDTYIGLQSPDTKRYGSFSTDQNNKFNVVALDYKGIPVIGKALTVEVFKIEWRWWWNRGSDNLSRYENTTIHKPYYTQEIQTNAQGQANFTLNIPNEQGGRYLVRVKDGLKGHATGITTYFYKDWWKRPSDGDTESSKILAFSSDKEGYNVGEKASITFPSEEGGRALLSIENGIKVLSTKWLETQREETTAEIEITADMAPNVYVNIALLQPHAQTLNDLPIRLYGVVPLMVNNPETRLFPEIAMPNELKPEETYTLEISEKENKPMTYTVAVVDEGLLDLTRFDTPRIHENFYARQSLGVRTFDGYDEVIGALSTSVGNIYAIGGGDAASDAKNKKAQRFKPVVNFIGPFALKPGETKTHTLKMPNYIGAVRTMVVAGNDYGAYGSSEVSTKVKKPLMVLTSLPRQLAPADKVTIPVTVFAMDKKVKNVSVKVDAGANLKPIGNSYKSIVFNSLGEQVVNFEFEVVGQSPSEKMMVIATSGAEKATETIEISIANPNPITTTSETVKIDPSQSYQSIPAFFGTSGTNALEVTFSTLPPMDISGRMSYLIAYPHGCLEQTTSSVFPQLYLEDIMELDINKKADIQTNIKLALKKLSQFQLPSGGMAYWPGSGVVNDWGTNYAGHFAIEAKNKGYQLPLTFLSNWIKYQRNAARQWTDASQGYNTQLIQAYRLYTLVLAGQPELAAMNRLRLKSNLNNEAKWRLAAAYALLGKQDIAKQLIKNTALTMQENNWDSYTYGTPFRNQAMLLESLVALGDHRQREEAVAIANRLSSNSWLSTQETAYALLSLSKMVLKNGGKGLKLKYTYANETGQIQSSKSMAKVILNPNKGAKLEVQNQSDAGFFLTTTLMGRLPLGTEKAVSQGLQLNVNYYDSAGKPIDSKELKQGSTITATLTVFNGTNEDLRDLALTHIIPSGWEILDTSYASGDQNQVADYMDIRDDRTHWYFYLKAKKSITFSTKINTSFLGTYYLPGAQVETMYDGQKMARTIGKTVRVVR